MRRTLLVFLIMITWASAAGAQTTPPAQSQDTRELRPATVSVTGDTGLWFLPTAEILPSGKWSVSFYRANADFGQGFTDVSNWPLSVGYGIGNRVELFGSWTTVTRIDRDARPLFFAPVEVGSGGGVVNEYPLVRQQWSGNGRGDLRVGAKINLISQANGSPVSFAVKGSVKIPTGNEDLGASTGKSDFAVDAIVSGETGGQGIELTATAGYVKRGDPDGFDLMSGIRWGVGAAFPSRSSLRVTTEIHGERYVGSGGANNVIAPPNFLAEDGSMAPLSTTVKHPLYVAAGLTWQPSGGFFIGGGLNWSSAVKDRVVGDNGFRDKLGIQFRIGYHPGVRTAVQAMAAPVDTAPVAAPPAAPTPANRPPVARAQCDPCTVEVGKVSTITATCSDPDNDVLTYRWVTNSGTIANASIPQTTWTAPMTVGSVPVTVTCTDPAGLSANADVTIQVVQPAAAAVKEYVFEDVHFDFDRNILRPDALTVLDEAVTALKASPTLKLQVEGHTCNIGTAEYNMALANRRAQAVRDYLASRGISADRLSVVAYGEEKPKHDNEREETRRLNRRAALTVSVVR